jgi:hypothetical protein
MITIPVTGAVASSPLRRSIEGSAFEDATSMTGLFVVVTGNGRRSQNINYCLEARANGRGLFRSLNPSAINFPLQVQWIDCGHRTHRSFKRPDLISHKRPDLISAKRLRHNWSTRNRTSSSPNLLSRHQDSRRGPSTTLSFRGPASMPFDAERPPWDCNTAPGAWHQCHRSDVSPPTLFNMRPFRKLVCIKGNSV